MNDIAIRASQVTKYFGKARPSSKNGNGRVAAVNRVSFDVARGEVFGVLGPNGSGKSTLIRLMATLLLPDEGQVLVFGHDAVREPMVVRRLINRVSVEAAFFKKLSPMENLIYGARLYGLDAGQARREIRQILDRLRPPPGALREPPGAGCGGRGGGRRAARTARDDDPADGARYGRGRRIVRSAGDPRRRPFGGARHAGCPEEEGPVGERAPTPP